MPSANANLLRDVFAAVARRDADSVLAFYDGEVEWDISRSPLSSVMGQTLYVGHAGLRQFFREWYEAWEIEQPHPEELIDAGEQVVSLVTMHGRGRASGASVEFKLFATWTIRDGKITRVVWFPTREAALEAASLGE